MSGVSRGKLIIAAAVVLFVLFGLGIYYDLRMPQRHSDQGEDKKGSSVTVSKLSLDRVISGDIWRLDSERAEKFDDRIIASEVTVVLTREDGQVWTTLSPEAVFRPEESTITMDSPVGKGKGATFDLDWTAPRVLLYEDREEVLFPDGIKAWTENGTLEASWGKVFSDGSIILENGAEVNWTIQD
jgi:hypothetical protein